MTDSSPVADEEEYPRLVGSMFRIVEAPTILFFFVGQVERAEDPVPNHQVTSSAQILVTIPKFRAMVYLLHYASCEYSIHPAEG
jgi:hypothetical protein